MYLSEIRVKNYRSLKELSLIFGKGKNIIVGKNNSGKSNIIISQKIPHYDNYKNITFNDFFGDVEKSKFILIGCILEKDETDVPNFREVSSSIYTYIENGKSIESEDSLKIDITNEDTIFQLAFDEEFKNKLDSSHKKFFIGHSNINYTKISYEEFFKKMEKFLFLFLAKYDSETNSVKKNLLFLIFI